MVIVSRDRARLQAALAEFAALGPVEGKAVDLAQRGAPEAVADEFGLSPDELWDRIVDIRAKLFAVREMRVRPGRDEKVLAAWNGLMLRSFALAARITGREDYREAAVKNATFIAENLKENGRIHRSYKDGWARFNGYLEDYAMVADGLVALYEATFETRWLVEASHTCGRQESKSTRAITHPCKLLDHFCSCSTHWTSTTFSSLRNY